MHAYIVLLQLCMALFIEAFRICDQSA